MLLGNKFTCSRLLAKQTGDILAFELASPEINFGSSFDWANKRPGIDDVWRIIVSKINILICVILVVDGELDWHVSQMEMISWGQALSFS